MINQIKQTETFKNFLYDINSFKILFKTGKKLPTQFRQMVKAALDGASTKQVIDLRSYEFKNLKIHKNENTFYNYFKDFENFQGMSFEQKVFTVTENLIRNLTKTDNFTAKLQRDFLNDFSEFLEVKYFKDNIGYEDNSDVNIFSKVEYFQRFKSVLQNNSYLDKNDILSIKRTFLAGIIAMLKKKGIIKNVTDIKIAQYMLDSFNYSISTSSLSNGTPYATKYEEEKLFEDLYDEFMIDY
ncbi:hypothetical protein SAMN05421796_105125 [Chryseobacterium piscicola]|uniref:Uncharacterized protein n=1 Tax=Chryseobacterium piscicola TaxID=551459 RepID=A0A1N7MQD2_9FLAO|nr:hypothetical protein [Chryseobacterium piscicola]PQA93406.1 hypothetical protein B0A70_09620 [Chryseobacterium piscicola]SIS88228.1 hypothetical protein SAMN05421796_105125 [Chryseobacterium piscicola]